MPESNEQHQKELLKTISSLNDKITELTSTIQKFGLDLITKMGQTNSKIKMLVDKIDKLDESTLDIKSLMPRLNNIIDNQNILESELDLIKSLIQKSNSSLSKEGIEGDKIERDESITKNKQIITEKFKELLIFIDNSEDIQQIKDNLLNIKEKIFELVGGHKILYEISQSINKFNNSSSLTENLKDYLKEKINFWINKL
jgi:hypothetical protein